MDVRRRGTMDCVEEIAVGVFVNKLYDEEIKINRFLASVYNGCAIMFRMNDGR